MAPPPQKITQSIERVFRAIELPGYTNKDLYGQIYQEVYMHFIHFLDPQNPSVVLRTKLDKNILGEFYRLARNDSERSLYGEVLYTFPSAQVDPKTQKPRVSRLIALPRDTNNRPILV